MGVRVRSLSEDGVDAYTHIWSVAFFLLLTFFLLVVPDKHSEIRGQKEPSHTQLEYEVLCWCPVQFEKSQVDYVNTICSNAYNTEMREKGCVRQPLFDVPPPREPLKSPCVKPRLRKEEPKTKKDNLASTNRIRQLSPVILFILAIALRIPQVLCSIISRCFDCVNIEETLESAQKGESTHYNNRRQTYFGLVQAIESATRTSGKASTYLYLLMKGLIVTVLIVEIVVITTCVLPHLQETPSKQENTSMVEVDKSLTSPSPSTSNDTLSEAVMQLKHQQQIEEQASSPIFLCFFEMRQMQIIHHYTIQCIVKVKQTDTKVQTQNTFSSMTLNVCLIVLANLVFLLVVHIINTLSWMVNLVSDSTRNRLGLGKGSPLDLVFLIQMARSNLGIGVAAGLVEAVGDGQSEKGDNEERFLLEEI